VAVAGGVAESQPNQRATNYSQPKINNNNNKNHKDDDLLAPGDSNIYKFVIRPDNDQEVSMESFAKQIMSGEIEIGELRNGNTNTNNEVST
jgi:DNA-directed RNA polymerase specialized sigma subunit